MLVIGIESKGRRQKKSDSFGWCAPQSRNPPPSQAVVVKLPLFIGGFFCLESPEMGK